MRSEPPRLSLGVSPLCRAVGLALMLIWMPAAASADPSASSKVSAKYQITFNGFDIGSFRFESSVDRATYTLASSAKVSALLGVLKWSGTTRSTGDLRGGEPKPSEYAFKYKSSSKSGSVDMTFSKGRVADRKLVPPSTPSKRHVPLTEEHLERVLDPMSAVLAITTGQLDQPCDRTIAVFDGKQRFDIALSFRRKERIKEAQPSGEPAVVIVCGVRYIPVAGHKSNKTIQSLAASEGIEVALRPIPSANMLVPYEVKVPTFAGSAVLRAQRVEITTEMRQIALVH